MFSLGPWKDARHISRSRFYGADLWRTVDDGGDDLTLTELDPAELVELAARAVAVPEPVTYTT